MLKKIGLVVAVLLVGLCIAIATRPDTYRVTRSTTIAAPPDVVFGYVNDFHQWTQWSPFEKVDPAMTRTYGGAPSGTGATYSWSGNRQAGEGTITVRESLPSQRIALDLHFLKPFESTAVTQFTFDPAPQGVNVTWAMSGENNFIGKAMSLFVSMDKMVGKEFEDGLATLKSLSEAEGKRRSAAGPQPILHGANKGDTVATLSGAPSAARPVVKKP
jgi:hypothetical protein